MPDLPRAAVMLVESGSFLLAAFFTPFAMAEDGTWTLATRQDGIEVYARSIPDSPVREVRATTEISATPARVFEVLLDSDRFVEFMPYIVEVRTVARESPSVWYLYQRISPPLVSDRDYTLRHQSIEDPKSGRRELRWEAANSRGPSSQEGVVRVDVCTGSYVVESLDAGARARLTYQLHTDPGGLLPKWLANRANLESVPALLSAIRNRATDPTWRR